MGKGFIHEIRSVVTGRRFWISVILMSVLFIVLTGYYDSEYPGNDILYYLMMVDFDSTAVAAVSIAAFAYSCIYCQERKQKIQDYVILRFGLKKYIWVKTCVGFLAGFLVFFIGKFIFIFIYSWKAPLVIAGGSGFRQSVSEVWGLRDLLLEGKYITYFVWMITVQSMRAGVISLVAQVLSLFVNEPMAIIGFPMMFNYIAYNYLDAIMSVPNKFSWLCIYDPTNRCCSSDGIQLLYTSTYTGTVILLIGIISYIIIKRKLYGTKNNKLFEK